MSSGSGPAGWGISGGIGSVLPGGGGTGCGSLEGLGISLSLDKGMPADWRASPHVQDWWLLVLLRVLPGLLTRLLVGLLILALLLLALLALPLLLFTILLRLLRVAVLGVVHR